MRVSRLLLTLAVFAVWPSCTCQRAENIEAKARLTKPAPPNPVDGLSAQKIDAAALDKDDKLVKRVCRMDVVEAHRRLSSFLYTSKGDLLFNRGAGKIRSAEKTRLLQSATDDFSSSLETGDGSTQDLAYVNGVFFLKNGNGQWRMSRDPTGERDEYRRDAGAVWRSFYDLFAHTLVVTANGTGRHAGRDVVKYKLAIPDQAAAARELGAQEPPIAAIPDGGTAAEATTPEENKRMADRVSRWRSKAKPAGGKGELYVDVETGVPLFVHFEGALLVGDAPEPARLEVNLEQSYTEVGKEHEIHAPKEAVEEIVRQKYPTNPRALLEENGIVKPEGKDAGAGGGAGAKAAKKADGPDDDEDAP